MKRRSINTFNKLGRAATLISLPILFTTACADSESGSSESFEESSHSEAIVTDFAEQVIVPTYKLLAKRAGALEEAVKELQDDKSDSNLEAAQESWRAAREPWESSEGFLFGPVDTYGFDPALDSWPVDKGSLDDVLESDDDLDLDYVKSLNDTLQGFHTAEYMLFGAASDKKVEDLSDRDMEYLSSVVSEMASLTSDLAAAWTKGIEGSDPYVDLVLTAGDAGNNVYPSRSSVAEEIVLGMIGILDEVANGKIADPFTEEDTKLVESQFSFNSLTDFSNNIRSVKNAYLGKNLDTGKSHHGLSDYVADVDEDLDERVKDEINAALDALSEIPEPFREAILDSKSADEITDAQEAIRKVQTTMEEDVLALFTH